MTLAEGLSANSTTPVPVARNEFVSCNTQPWVDWRLNSAHATRICLGIRRCVVQAVRNQNSDVCFIKSWRWLGWPEWQQAAVESP